jgi:hypothetical protein
MMQGVWYTRRFRRGRNVGYERFSLAEIRRGADFILRTF